MKKLIILTTGLLITLPAKSMEKQREKMSLNFINNTAQVETDIGMRTMQLDIPIDKAEAQAGMFDAIVSIEYRKLEANNIGQSPEQQKINRYLFDKTVMQLSHDLPGKWATGSDRNAKAIYDDSISSYDTDFIFGLKIYPYRIVIPVTLTKAKKTK